MEKKARVEIQGINKEAEEAAKLSTPPTKQFNVVTDKEELRKPCAALTEDTEIIEITGLLNDFMLNGPAALGIAAPQLGIHKRAFAMLRGLETSPDAGIEQLEICINPEIKKVYGGETLFKEACLSEPGITAIVHRHKKIKVKYQTPDGRIVKTTFQNTDACIFQHELDHLNGRLLVDKAEKIFKSGTSEEVKVNEQAEAKVHDSSTEAAK